MSAEVDGEGGSDLVLTATMQYKVRSMVGKRVSASKVVSDRSELEVVAKAKNAFWAMLEWSRV